MWRAVWRLLVAETPDAQQHWLSYGELYRDLDGSGPETRYILTLPSSAACEMVTQRWGERITQLLRRYNPTARLAAIVQPAALVA